MLLGRVGRINPESIDDYRAHGGYEALRRSLNAGGELGGAGSVGIAALRAGRRGLSQRQEVGSGQPTSVPGVQCGRVGAGNL